MLAVRSHGLAGKNSSDQPDRLPHVADSVQSDLVGLFHFIQRYLWKNAGFKAQLDGFVHTLLCLGYRTHLARQSYLTEYDAFGIHWLSCWKPKPG